MRNIKSPVETRARVREASKELLRYISREKLLPGDRLMQQHELRSILGFSNNTLTPAMANLTRMGVLRRSRGLGTVIVDPEAGNTDLWNIAVPVYPSSVSLSVPFFAQLCQCIQSRLRELGYGCTIYPSSLDTSLATHTLNNFPTLADAWETGAADAILSPVLLHPDLVTQATKKRVPVCHVGPWNDVSNGVIIDMRQMVIEGVRVLAGQGCRQLALASASPIPSDHTYYKTLIEAIREAGLDAAFARTYAEGHGPASGRVVAAKLMATPEKNRPDGLVILDDWVAMGLAGQIREAGQTYRPKLAVQVNRQAPLTFALPVFRFEVDIATLAAAAVGMAAGRLLNRTAPDELRLYPPVFAGLQLPE